MPEPLVPTARPPAPRPTTPSPADPAWPAAVPERTAIQGGPDPLTVVWLAVDAGPSASDLDEAVARVEAVGYEGLQTPLSCQADAWEPLGVPGGQAFGVPLYFAGRADAERFVALWDGPVAAVVEGDVFCHFD
ncbi:hypothetical protein [Cellulomonas sp. ATA003]|uniref:hypothetical protein n=1 Tax=Cellulomonas sp. ATA003 TaxID=3073064 RepID=UPI0028731A78|nr:hypothetical protein [Cellulomonas sp. ATA003]WNB84478.1 hypothetical protein REH70_11565 [Cellulomonas sp. ATA003]